MAIPPPRRNNRENISSGFLALVLVRQDGLGKTECTKRGLPLPTVGRDEVRRKQISWRDTERHARACRAGTPASWFARL